MPLNKISSDSSAPESNYDYGKGISDDKVTLHIINIPIYVVPGYIWSDDEITSTKSKYLSKTMKLTVLNHHQKPHPTLILKVIIYIHWKWSIIVPESYKFKLGIKMVSLQNEIESLKNEKTNKIQNAKQEALQKLK